MLGRRFVTLWIAAGVGGLAVPGAGAASVGWVEPVAEVVHGVGVSDVAGPGVPGAGTIQVGWVGLVGEQEAVVFMASVSPTSAAEYQAAASWLGTGWLPRMPESPEMPDLLLLTVPTPRKVHRDGIQCHGPALLVP